MDKIYFVLFLFPALGNQLDIKEKKVIVWLERKLIYMKKAAVIVAPGFEEGETLTIVDILWWRRCNAQLQSSDRYFASNVQSGKIYLCHVCSAYCVRKSWIIKR